ncbi:hypothetical protein [Campylobacter sp. RM16191]|uniref:hypothetical protein n=1 Tax=Campylobacter sp. RM16191 TaxID=1705728 RepID=UPI0014734201|nr:hypothetical protein [Campylobacter sp. RM16191]
MLNEKSRQTAFKLLDKFGKVGIYRHQGEQIYNPDTGGMQTDYQEIKVKAYIDSAKSYPAMVEKGLITLEDNVILIAAKSLPFMPRNNDEIVFPHATYAIKFNDAVWGGEDVALHQLVGVAK